MSEPTKIYAVQYEDGESDSLWSTSELAKQRLAYLNKNWSKDSGRAIVVARFIDDPGVQRVVRPVKSELRCPICATLIADPRACANCFVQFDTDVSGNVRPIITEEWLATRRIQVSALWAQDVSSAIRRAFASWKTTEPPVRIDVIKC